MKNRIIQIICEICNDNTLNNNENVDLIDEGIIDSISFSEVVSALEEEFEIEIQVTQENPNTWRSVDAITRMIKESLMRNEE